MRTQKMWNASRFCVSSLRRGHANLLCIVPILLYVLPKQDKEYTLIKQPIFKSIKPWASSDFFPGDGSIFQKERGKSILFAKKHKKYNQKVQKHTRFGRLRQSTKQKVSIVEIIFMKFTDFKWVYKKIWVKGV
jgi:hypothetical protein